MHVSNNRLYSFYQSAVSGANKSGAWIWIKDKYSASVKALCAFPILADYSLRKMVNENYMTTLKSVKSIKDAQIICLAETHGKKKIQLQNAKIIDALYRPGDLVLVETLSDQPVSQSFHMTQYVTVPITVKGWDGPLDSFEGSPWWEAALNSNLSRHNNMHRVIEESLSEHKRIFLIAGRLHLYEKDPLLKDVYIFPSVVQAVKNTMEFLKEKRSIVLIPKACLNSLAAQHPYLSDLSSQEKTHIQGSVFHRTTLEFNPNIFHIHFSQHPTLSLTIRNQDIFDSGAEVIVNSSNTQLCRGNAGIDAAIHAKGGDEYRKAHEKLREKNKGQYAPGIATIIKSGALKSTHHINHVIVVAAPQGPSTPQTDGELYSCYYNSLAVAQGQGKSSIAFPSISTGVQGFPKNRAAAISLKAIHDFIQDYPDTCLKTISIHFLANDSCFSDYVIACS